MKNYIWFINQNFIAMDGNYQLKVGGKFDTGKKFVDSNGVPSIIYGKLLESGSLPNATAANVAHGESVDVNKPWSAKAWADNNTTAVQDGTDIKLAMNATNIVVTTVANLSSYHGKIYIEFCLAGGTES